ncbi:PREDICTED: tubulin polyglutamylase complex subunit 1 [Mandrillus leucophaeus]|uniref:tubulin polyglutamylase complex subunit 1 n=1 Tax=Mandrillus leucophaeus TaxID=9568 RepID=UPI0005F3F3EB|nr:PREDICTED: tubulin polyglutamylase complex subunit 1 [Mandrillus leucophaeus]
MAVLPVPMPSAKMAAVEKRRPAVAPPAGFTDSGRQSVSRAAGAAESEEDFLRQVGVTEMLRAALLKVLEARPEEPIAFLAHYFENMGLRSPVNGGAGEPPGQLLLQQQRLGRALWHLRLAHHSQRCAAGRLGRVGRWRTSIPSMPRAAPYPQRRRGGPGRAGSCSLRCLFGRDGPDKAGWTVRAWVRRWAARCMRRESFWPASRL